jgi:hypothetical protein
MAVRLWAVRAGRRFTAKKTYFASSGTRFCQRLSKPQDPLRPEVLDKLMKIIHLIRSRARFFPACSAVRQSLCYRVAQRGDRQNYVLHILIFVVVIITRIPSLKFPSESDCDLFMLFTHIWIVQRFEKRSHCCLYVMILFCFLDTPL